MTSLTKRKAILNNIDIFFSKECGSNNKNGWVKEELKNLCTKINIKCDEESLDELCSKIRFHFGIKKQKITLREALDVWDELKEEIIDIEESEKEIKEKKFKENLIDKEWGKYESRFSKDFVDNDYPDQQSKEKKAINNMLVNSIKESGIPEDSQTYLILENIRINTIKAILLYNTKVKIYVPECITETCYKIAEKVYKHFPDQREQVDFYPGNMLDSTFIRELSEEQKQPFPNIAFLDFTNTFKTNHSTINEILKVWGKDSDSVKVLALTFSLRGEHHSIKKYNCGENKDDNSVINCVTKQIFKLFSKNGFIPKNVYRLVYQRTIPGKRSGRMVYHCYTIRKTKTVEKLNKIRDMSMQDINKQYGIYYF